MYNNDTNAKVYFPIGWSLLNEYEILSSVVVHIDLLPPFSYVKCFMLPQT